MAASEGGRKPFVWVAGRLATAFNVHDWRTKAIFIGSQAETT